MVVFDSLRLYSPAGAGSIPWAGWNVARGRRRQIMNATSIASSANVTAITVTSLSYYLVGEGIRDALDPRFQRR